MLNEKPAALHLKTFQFIIRKIEQGVAFLFVKLSLAISTCDNGHLPICSYRVFVRKAAFVCDCPYAFIFLEGNIRRLSRWVHWRAFWTLRILQFGVNSEGFLQFSQLRKLFSKSG